MHRHRRWSCMSTLLHLHVMCVWGDIPIGLGTSFKPSVEIYQTCGECINHLHHIHHSGITISASWLFNSPIPFVIFWSSQPLSTWFLQCLQLMTIGSSVTLNSTVMEKVLSSRTSLWLWDWFPTLRFDHWLFRRLSHKPLVSHILLLLWLHLLSICGSYHRFFRFHKLHFLGYISSRTAFTGVSQSTFYQRVAFDEQELHQASWRKLTLL